MVHCLVIIVLNVTNRLADWLPACEPFAQRIFMFTILCVVFLICFISDNFYILSLSKKFVNNFFYFFKSFFQVVSQELFESTLETLVDSRFVAASSQRRILIYHSPQHKSTIFLHFFHFFLLINLSTFFFDICTYFPQLTHFFFHNLIKEASLY